MTSQYLETDVDVEIGALSDAVAAIYDSAVDPDLWPIALELVAGLIGGQTASIGISDAMTRETLIRTTWGVPEPFLSNYSHYVASMPFYEAYARMSVEEAKAGSSMYDMDAFRRSEFYEKWAKPQGLQDVAALCIMNDSRRFGLFGVNTGDDRPLVGPRDLDVIRLLTPHIRRAASISDLLDISALSARQMEAALDVLDTGILLVDANLKVLHANEAGVAALECGKGLATHSGRLTAQWPKTLEAIEAAVARAARSDLAMGRSGFSVPAPEDGHPTIILHVLPVCHSPARRELASAATAAIFVSSTTSATTALVDALAALYDLSRAESITLTHIANGQTQSQTAAKLGVSDSTVKTHLSKVFKKTETSRQPELARLVGSLALAIRP